MERVAIRDRDIEIVRQNQQMDELERSQMIRAKSMKSIADVVEEVEVLIDTHFFNQFSERKSSMFLKKVIANQNVIEMGLFKTWKSLNCTPKTMKVIREIQENLLCVGKRKELITKKKTELRCFCSKTGALLNAKHIISCCSKVSGEIKPATASWSTSSRTTSSNREG